MNVRFINIFEIVEIYFYFFMCIFYNFNKLEEKKYKIFVSKRNRRVQFNFDINNFEYEIN